MKFCPICGGMMKKQGNKYVCSSCGYTEDVTAENTVSRKIIIPANDREAIIVDTGERPLPKTRIKCPKCGNMEAYYTVMQTRSADEPETRIYICTKCGYTWREY